MKPPKCRLCEKHHWGNCEVQEEVQRKDAPSSKADDVVEDRVAVRAIGKPSKASPEREGCPECGATAKTFADAEKWSKHREKRRVYMKKRRKK